MVAVKETLCLLSARLAENSSVELIVVSKIISARTHQHATITTSLYAQFARCGCKLELTRMPIQFGLNMIAVVSVHDSNRSKLSAMFKKQARPKNASLSDAISPLAT